MNVKDYLEIVVAALTVVGFFTTLIGGFFHLKGETRYARQVAEGAQKDIDELRVRHESLDSKIVEQLSQVRESLARLEGALGTHVTLKGER